MLKDRCLLKHLRSKPGLKIVCAMRGHHTYREQLPDDVWFVIERADDTEPAIIDAAHNAAAHYVKWLRLITLDITVHGHTGDAGFVPKSVFRWEHKDELCDADADAHQWVFLAHLQAKICEILGVNAEDLPGSFITGFGG